MHPTSHQRALSSKLTAPPARRRRCWLPSVARRVQAVRPVLAVRMAGAVTTSPVNTAIPKGFESVIIAFVPFPEWIEPMGATLTQERFTGPEWVFEHKFDGIRLLAFRQGNDVRLLSRNRLPQNCPPIAEALKRLPAQEIILDGEITWGTDGAAYHVFDLLWLDGRDVSLLPLDERHALLQSLRLEKPLQRVARLSDEKPWERACREGWEGVIAKRRDTRYEHRRSPHWLKMKCETSQEFVVGGFADPQGVRKAGRPSGRVLRER